MIPIHRGRLNISWKNYQRINKTSHKQMAKAIGCPVSEVKSLLKKEQSPELKTPYSEALVDLFGSFIRLDYHPPSHYRTFVSNSNRFQVNELDLVVKPRYSDLEVEKKKQQDFVEKHKDLFCKQANYPVAMQCCEDIERKYLAFKQTLQKSPV